MHNKTKPNSYTESFAVDAAGKEGKNGIYIRAYTKSLKKAKAKLKELTSRSQGRNVRKVMENVKAYIRGWLGYFGIAGMKTTMQEWDGWLRRRFRCYIRKQWKLPKTRVKNLIQLGVPEWAAYRYGNSRKGYWRLSGTTTLARAISNKRLAQAGYYSMELLKERKLEQLEQQEKAGEAWSNPMNLVYTMPLGSHLIPQTVVRHYKKCISSIGRPDARFHDLRHSYAVASIRSGDGPKELQAALGHHSPSFSLNVYGHVTDQMQQASAARMENYIKVVLGE